MNAVIDRKTLSWIKTEVEESLKSAQDAPTAFAENLDDASPIEACLSPLRRVRGAVEMVNIQGATILADELEYLAQALVENRINHKAEAADALAMGMLQLPAYLESLYHGQPDIPLILLPQLNDLRAAQDKELLTEGDFFSPDFSVVIPIEHGQCVINGDFATVAKKLRPGYLSGLLGVIREENLTENLEKMITVIDNLMFASDSQVAQQFWVLVSGVLDSLYENSLELSVALKILLGRVDRQIKFLLDNGEAAFSAQPPHKISKNLLYYIGQSKSYNNRVTQIKKSFNLDYPDDDLVKKAREDLYGFSVNLVENIALQVNEELAKIKDVLDITLHAKQGATDDLEPVLQQFTTVADALGMLGLSKLRDMMNHYKGFVQDKIAGAEALSEEDLMGIAAALLHVESALTDFDSALTADSDENSLPRAEYEKLLKLVAEEVIKDMAAVKQALSDFSQSGEHNERLEQIPQVLHQLVGAMQLLRHTQQAGLLQAVNLYMTNEFLSDEQSIDAHQLDLLADAIMGVENYYESILEYSVAPELGLSIAAESMNQLGYSPDSALSQLQQPYDDDTAPEICIA